VPAAEYQPAKRLRLLTAKAASPIRFGRLLEQQPDWVWATVESSDHTVPMPSVDSILATPVPPTAANE
jgi:bifunctional N-acetylglucosamine-1-phosphate-uridyltransferase/glucosamine-1-phosphate-acetyltransferase GlmU-like protein